MDVEHLRVARAEVHAGGGRGMVADDMRLSEEVERAADEVVEVGGDQQLTRAVTAEQVGEAEDGVGERLALDLLAEVRAPLVGVRPRLLEPIGVAACRVARRRSDGETQLLRPHAALLLDGPGQGDGWDGDPGAADEEEGRRLATTTGFPDPSSCGVEREWTHAGRRECIAMDPHGCDA